MAKRVGFCDYFGNDYSSDCVCAIRLSLNTMTLQIQSDHVYTQLGVAISVTGIAQVSCTVHTFNTELISDED